jgi:hypothetical protein
VNSDSTQFSQEALLGRVDQLDPVPGAPVSDLGFAVRTVVVADQIQLPGREPAAQLLAEVQELGPPFPVTEPVNICPVARSSAANICRTPCGRV